MVKNVPHASEDELFASRHLQDEISEDNSDIPYEEFELNPLETDSQESY